MNKDKDIKEGRCLHIVRTNDVVGECIKCGEVTKAPKPPKEEWEERFDERYRVGDNVPLTNRLDDVKAFIKAELTKQREEVVREIEEAIREMTIFGIKYNGLGDPQQEFTDTVFAAAKEVILENLQALKYKVASKQKSSRSITLSMQETRFCLRNSNVE